MYFIFRKKRLFLAYSEFHLTNTKISLDPFRLLAELFVANFVYFSPVVSTLKNFRLKVKELEFDKYHTN